MQNKKLLYIFLGLLAIYGITQFGFQKKTKSFKSELIQLDTAAVTSITILPKSDSQEEMVLVKENGEWMAKKGSIQTKANRDAVMSILRNLSLIKTKRVATKNPEKWSDYEVAVGEGSQLKVYQGDQELANFIVGRFNFNQQTRQGISYVRLADSDEVYAVDGFLSMTMGQGFDSYRNKELLKIDKNQLTQISINREGMTEIYQKNGNDWTVDGVSVDSTKMANFLTGLQSVNGNTFADDFEVTASNSLLFNTLSLEGNNISTPIIIRAFRDTSRTLPYVIHSSMNPEGYFESGADGVFEQLFGI